MNFKNKVVWITGASSGIGEALAFEMAGEGAKLVLSARNGEMLEKVREKCLLNNGECLTLPFDITDHSSGAEAVRKIQERYGGVDVVIHNAGVSQRALGVNTSIEVDRHIMDVNYFGAVALTKNLIPVMKGNGGGLFVVVSSILGKFGYPARTAYAASKHALHGFFESFRIELMEDNIRICMVCPGRIDTGISFHALLGNGKSYCKMEENHRKGMPVEVCARNIVKGVKAEKKEIYIGGKEVIMVYLRRFFPYIFYNIVAKSRFRQ